MTEEEEKFLMPPLDPYDNPLVMSLKDFVEHPISKELLHNGQTFQVSLGGQVWEVRCGRSGVGGQMWEVRGARMFMRASHSLLFHTSRSWE